jgi:hypothetical protein
MGNWDEAVKGRRNLRALPACEQILEEFYAKGTLELEDTVHLTYRQIIDITASLQLLENIERLLNGKGRQSSR